MNQSSEFSVPVFAADDRASLGERRGVERRRRRTARDREGARMWLSLFHSSPAAIVRLDSDGLVRDWNRAARRTFRWRSSEARGRPLTIFPGRGRQVFEELLAGVRAGRTVRIESIAAERRWGDAIELSLCGAPLFDDFGAVAGVLLTGIDVSERSRAERRLRLVTDVTRILARAERIADAAAPIAARLAESCRWSRCEWWDFEPGSATWRRMANWKSPVDRVPDDSPKTDADRDSSAEIHSDTDADDEEVEGAEDAASLAERDGLPGLVRGERRILQVPSLAIPGAVRSRVSGDAIAIPVLVDDRVDAAVIGFAPSLPPLDPQLAEALASISLQIGFRLRDERAARERVEHEEGVRQSSKMDAIGLLAGGIAHDFNNLLTVILDHAEIAQHVLDHPAPRAASAEAPDGAGRREDACASPSDLRDMLREIEGAGRRAAALVRQLLAFSRKDMLQPAVIELNPRVREMRKLLDRLLERTVHLELDLAADLHRVKVDPTQLEQVLLNLVVNARDAMPAGGRIRIATRNRKLRAHEAAHHPDARCGDYAVLEVADDGCGIAPAAQRQVFEPFFTTKPRDKGTGMGLATVHAIVRQSGGFIELASAPDAGTTFSIHLPRSREALEPIPVDEPLEDIPGGTETILLAEDEDALRSLIERILAAKGYRVLSAADGADAVRLLPEHAREIRLLLTDVLMPGLTGPELMSRVRHAAPFPPPAVLYMSGYSEATLLERSSEEELRPLLPKPFRVDVLLRRVREVLDAADGRGVHSR
ncbi:MAG: ATP-binding protein [Planctomycetaceae bacterium]